MLGVLARAQRRACHHNSLHNDRDASKATINKKEDTAIDKLDLSANTKQDYSQSRGIAKRTLCREESRNSGEFVPSPSHV